MLPKYILDEEDENYMNPKQLDYFRNKLITWKQALQRESAEKAREVLQSHADADLTDMATREYDTDLTLQTCDRNDALTVEIDKALQRIDNGLYGYCEETGEKIGTARLEANPVTLYCIEEQERREKQQKLYSDEGED
ncbi:dnaK suppressor protein [Anaplasma centrale str. Israel]|uniref:DnaK suppressor protein n=1 Tax=Anaplasma centrale (strain Israel) TaxID=574556 RepID=D1ATN7_ANACI|nr:TraR/DksA C4-type zinc finger protein [Anaplasma centrale]ACZ48915.1 dnaK suppressor protein [Anaplasma centrale str. Israel]